MSLKVCTSGHASILCDVVREHWVLSIFALFALRQLWILLQRLYFTSLHNIPGPKKAALHAFFGFRMEEIPFEALHNLHKTYGPVVRTGPNEVSITSPSELHKIYGIENSLQKAPFYEMFRSPGVQGPMFAMRDQALHRVRRKLLNPAYSKTSVAALHPWILRQCELLCDQISASISNGEPVDSLRCFRMLAGDTALKVAFNLEAGMVKNASTHPIMQQINIEMGTPFYIRNFARRLLPYTPQWIINRLPVWFDTQLFAMARVEAMSRKYLTTYIEQVQGAPSGEKNAEAMSWILDAKNPSTGEPLSVAEMTAEARSLILAGSDTTAATLTYTTWLLLQNPSALEKLRTELATVMGDLHQLPENLSTIEGLPYLTACINESMRLYPAIPGPFPRLVPPSGLAIGGHYLPGGTVVSASALAVHRSDHSGVWGAAPEQFRPERWLESEADAALMRKTLLTFGMGMRSCIGREVALIQIYAMTAAFISRFDGSVARSYKADMRPAGTFNVSIKGEGCLLELKDVA